MRKLLDGIARFHRNHRNVLPWNPTEVVLGQSPKALMLTCSDSRVVPHLFMDAGVGDLFMLRNAGNLVPPAGVGSSEEASLTFAIEVLAVRHIIVCGHTECGAIKALSVPNQEPPPALAMWLSNASIGEMADGTLLQQVQANVLAQVQRLGLLPAVRGALDRGQVRTHAWVYDIATGVVSSYDEALDLFTPVCSADPGDGNVER